jgi:hypothetical protein
MNDPLPLGRIVALLDRARIPHMLTGSFASTFHGPPRTTQDIDLVIDPSPEALEHLLQELPPDRYYVSATAAREALALRRQFNVIDLETGWKIDLIIRKERPYSLEEFARRQPARVASAQVFVTSAEDTVLSKLEWAKQGESERQLRDVVGVLKARGAALDIAYLERWVDTLSLAGLWQRARQLAADPE